MSKEVFTGHKVRRKMPPYRAFQWNGNGSVPDLRLFLDGLKVRILVDQDDLSLWLKWDSHYCNLPTGGWLVRNPSEAGSNAISYHKAKEFFDEFEYTEPLELKK